MADIIPARDALMQILSGLEDLSDKHEQWPSPSLESLGPTHQEAAFLALTVWGLPIRRLLEFEVGLYGLMLTPAIEMVARHDWARVVAGCASRISQGDPEQENAIDLLGLLGRCEFSDETIATQARREACIRVLLDASPLENGRTKNPAAILALAGCGYYPALEMALGLSDEDSFLITKVLGLLGSLENLKDLSGIISSNPFLTFSGFDEVLEKICQRHGLPAEIAEKMLKPFGDDVPRGLGGLFQTVLPCVGKYCPDVFTEHLSRWVKSSDYEIKEILAKSLPRINCLDPLPILLNFIDHDRDENVVKAALLSLHELDAVKGQQKAVKKLKFRHWIVRVAALNILKEVDDPALMERILPMVRDSDNDVREAALLALEKYENPRVVAETVSTLNDDQSNVRQAAEQILLRGLVKEKNLPPASEFVLEEPPWWETVTGQLTDIKAWGEKKGKELLGVPVRVIRLRGGLGRTPVKAKSGVIQIEVSDLPLVSRHPHGADIMRGVILHEIGHHLYDIGESGCKTMEGIASSEGIRSIFNILIDERLERCLRSRCQAWGKYFDRVVSYAFPQEEHLIPVAELAALLGKSPEDVASEIQAGKLPGRLLAQSTIDKERMVRLTILEEMTFPGLNSRLMLFLAFLRCRMDLNCCPDSRVIQAVLAVPRSLKDMPHAGVLEVARQIGDLIGRDEDHRKYFRKLHSLMARHQVALQGLMNVLRRMREAGLEPAEVFGGRNKGTGTPGPRGTVPGFEGLRGQTAGRMIRIPGSKGKGGQVYNTGPETVFSKMTFTETLQRDPAQNLELRGKIIRHVRRLRPYMQQLGTREITEGGYRKGLRLERPVVAGAILRHDPNIFLQRMTVVETNCYIGILIDRSGSMEDGKLELAKAFAALVAEAGARISGLKGHINAFDDDTFYRLGDFRCHAIGSLVSGGGNNDSGALMRAAELAQASRRANRLLVMISDGSPTACTFTSLAALVQYLTKKLGIACAQVAVDTIEDVAFPNFVNIHDMGFDEAVARFGRLLIQLTKGW